MYLADTLASPNTVSEFQGGLLEKPLTADREAARAVKQERNITVCLGNPPYDRGTFDSGGWITNSEGNSQTAPKLEAFTKPVRDAGKGIHLVNLYNLYVYFWRWALWKVFESPDYQGVVTFITASSYLRGPAFAGMRRVMRESFDELWIIDLEGDNLGARKTENIFAIQSPVTIAIGLRSNPAHTAVPAVVRKVTLTGSSASKLNALAQIYNFEDVKWTRCFSGWDEPFHSQGTSLYFDWPTVDCVFPWQHSGCKMGRTWPIGVDQQVLVRRWQHLKTTKQSDRPDVFKESRDRKVTTTHSSLMDDEARDIPIGEIDSEAPVPPIVRYPHRTLDRRWVLLDSRLGDLLRPVLWRTHSERQVYLTSKLTDVLGSGPSAAVASNIPDLHHFDGRGARDVIPLYKDAAATIPNVTAGLLDLLNVSAPDLFAYTYGILAQPSYVERFWDELELPPPRLPLTKDRALFAEVAAHGRRLIYLHTYGERFAADGDSGSVPIGSAKCTQRVPTTQADYPNEYWYDPQTQTLHVGKGQFAPVQQEIYEYSVSGLKVVQSWLGYRMRERKGRKSSPLDEIRPQSWTFSGELLELLWVLEHTIQLEPAGAALLDRVLESDLWLAEELPKPTKAERQPPKPAPRHDGQLGLDV